MAVSTLSLADVAYFADIWWKVTFLVVEIYSVNVLHVDLNPSYVPVYGNNNARQCSKRHHYNHNGDDNRSSCAIFNIVTVLLLMLPELLLPW